MKKFDPEGYLHWVEKTAREFRAEAESMDRLAIRLRESLPADLIKAKEDREQATHKPL